MDDVSKGDRVRVDIPVETDPDHEQYHGIHGQVVAVISDDAATVTGDQRDENLYRVALESGNTVDFRRRDLRSPIDD